MDVEIAWCWVCTRRKSLRPQTGVTGTECHRFFAKLRFWKCVTFTRAELWPAILKRRALVQSMHKVVQGSPGSHWQRDHYHSWNTFGGGHIASQRTKDPACANKQPFIGRGQRCVQRVDNPVTALWCHSKEFVHHAGLGLFLWDKGH